jgi:hypothetical protein
MRRLALLSLTLTLSGCGYNTWSNLPFTTGSNPNRPVTNSENMRRVMGEGATVQPLTPEPGDIWPGPLAPAPTLQDLEKTGSLQPGVEQPVPGSPLGDGTELPGAAPGPTHGSSTPPGSAAPALRPAAGAPSGANPRSAAAPPPAKEPGGKVYQTPSGPAVTNGGGPGYQTTATPDGNSSIIVPNGNGTSTVIHSDGRIETVPTPK